MLKQLKGAVRENSSFLFLPSEKVLKTLYMDDNKVFINQIFNYILKLSNLRKAKEGKEKITFTNIMLERWLSAKIASLFFCS